MDMMLSPEQPPRTMPCAVCGAQADTVYRFSNPQLRNDVGWPVCSPEHLDRIVDLCNAGIWVDPTLLPAAEPDPTILEVLRAEWRERPITDR